MTTQGKGHRKNRRKGSGKPPGWLVLGALAASTALSGRLAPDVWAQEKPGEPAPRALPARRLDLPLGYGEPSLLALLDATWEERRVPAETIGGADRDNRTAQGQDTPALRFEIPPGPLGAALVTFEQTTGLRVEVSHETVRGIVSPGVAGLFTAGQALEELLAGTGVTWRFTEAGLVRLDLPAVADSFDVTAHPEPSSPKYTQPLRDTPQTLTVIPQTLIEEQGAATLRDVLRNVTGISLQAGEGGGGLPGDNLTIRGFAARNDIFVDGVRDFGAYSRDPFNVEQVEVTKGPASLYTGRGSTGGSLNLSTKTPHLEASRGGTVGAGTGDYGRATLDLNQPLPNLGIEGTAVRLNLLWTDAGVPGRDAVENRRWGVAPSIAFGLGTPTRITFDVSHLDQDNTPEYGLPWVPANHVALAPYADKPAPVDYDNFYGLTGRDYEKTVTDLTTGKIEHDVNEALTLRSLVRHGRATRDSIITAPRFASTIGTDLNRQLQSRDLTDTILAYQGDLSARFATGSLEHAIVAGLEAARESSENRSRTGPAAPLADLFHPNPDDSYPGPITHTGARTESTAETAAVYVADTVKLGERWQISAGLRWDHFGIDFDSIAADGAVTPFDRTDRMVSWRAGVVHKPRENGSLYLAAGTSFNPSADGAIGLSLSASTEDLAPEKSRSYEGGTKWDFFGSRLAVNAAVFRTEKTNARTPGVNPGDPPVVLQGEQRVDGVELGLSGRLTDRWSAFAGYTWLTSEIRESNTAAEVGKELTNTPEHSVSLWTTYRLRRGFEIGGGAQFVDDRFSNTTNTRVAPDYWLFDAMASYDLNSSFTLRLNVNNLANERYIDRVGGGHFIPGPGRSVALTTIFHF